MTTTSTNVASQSIPYAVPTNRPGSRAWAGAAIVFSGLSLIVVGGCFLIGILSIVKPELVMNAPSQKTLSSAEIALMAVLYGLAFASFAGGTWVIVIGVRGLLRVMRS